MLIVLTAFGALAAEPPGYVRWPAAELKGLGAKVAPKMNAQKFATEQLAKFGNYYVMVAYREADGEAELHQTQHDIFIVESGEGVVVLGGEVQGGKTTAPGEIRGVSIQGGRRMPLGPGDVVSIPAKTPHQVLVKPGGKITYLVVKIDAP
jgi:mannose-6-phosphate isomerase-like protein (cupin superfamily)